MIGSIAEGITEIENFLLGEDCISTINCMKNLGVDIELKGTNVKVQGKGLYLNKSEKILDVGNSGTTIRLLMGILAGQNLRQRLQAMIL